MRLEFSTVEERVATVLAVGGEIDLATRDQLRAAVQDLLREGRARIVLDLGDVDFIDSSGLGVLLGARRDAESAGGFVRLVLHNPHVLKVFTVTNLTEVFDIHPTREEALAAIAD